MVLADEVPGACGRGLELPRADEVAHDQIRKRFENSLSRTFSLYLEPEPAPRPSTSTTLRPESSRERLIVTPFCTESRGATELGRTRPSYFSCRC
jgi:hypothetical protein